MKTPAIALAALAAVAASPIHAQSSVTLFGIVDATIAYGSGSLSSKTRLASGGYSSSRLGVRGNEDLGDGMYAAFWLEAGINSDDGTGTATNTNNQATGADPAVAGTQGLTFNRRSTVSLGGNWGEVRLGRDFTPQFWSLTNADPFATTGVGSAQPFNSIITGVTSVRASNSVGYFLPRDIGGLYGQLQYYMGENASNAANKNDGTGMAVRAGFAKGPFDVALTLSKTKYLAGDVGQNNLGGSYDFGVMKLTGVYAWDKNGALAGTGGHRAKGYLVGGWIPVGLGAIRLAYSRYNIDQTVAGTLNNPSTKKFALGYSYNLSKRTVLYATYARVANSGGAASALNSATTAANASSTGYDFGLRHAF